MLGHLIRIDARDSAGAPVPVRLASVDDRRLCHIDDAAWVPAIDALPALSYDFFGGDFAGRIATPAGTITVSLSGLPQQTDQRFAGSRVQIWSGQVGAPYSGFVPRFDGRLTGEPTVQDGMATLEIAVDDAWLDKPLLKMFAGTGGIEGPDDLEGTVKPLILGACRFAPGVLIDAVNIIYCVSGHGPIIGTRAAYDKAISLGASRGDFADLAVLIAAELPNGSWATCNALGLVRLASPPDGKVSFDVWGPALPSGALARLPGGIVGYLAAMAGGVVSQRNLDLLDRARPWRQCLALNAQTTARDAIQQLADGLCAVAGLTQLGVLFLQPLEYTEPTLDLDGAGRSALPVADVQVQPVATPYWRLATQAEPTWNVHGPAEVGTAYVYRGKWDADRVYRLDDMVSLDGGSAWVYIAAVAQAGVKPGTAAAVWRQYEGDATYSDGTPIDDLKPAQPGATEGGTVGVDIKIPDPSGLPGRPPIPAPPGLLRNDLIRLREDGGLVYAPYGDPAVEEELGKIALPAIGAASDGARRQLEGAVDRLGTALVQALGEANRTRETLRDAGVYVDPASGTVKIAAIERTAERVSEAYIRLTAAESAITLRATRTYVDNAVATAVLDPSQVPVFEGLEVRISEAEIRLDGAEASIAQKASIISVDALGVRLGTAEVNIDALAGQIALKVDDTEFDALGARVASAETTLEALGDTASITQGIVASRMLPGAVGDANESALRALLTGDAAKRAGIESTSAARTELTVMVNDGRGADARARQELIVRIGAAESSALTETASRIEGDRVVSLQVTNLSASTDTRFAAFDQRVTALVDRDDLIVTSLTQTVSAVRGLGDDAAAAAESALRALLTGDRSAREQAGAMALARSELTVKINGDVDAVAQRVTALLLRLGVAEASIVSEQLARAAADLAIVSQIGQIRASVEANAAAIRDEQLARADADTAQASRIGEIMARIGEDGAPDAIEALISAASSAYAAPLLAQAGRIDSIDLRLGQPSDPNSVESKIAAAATAYATPLLAQAERTDQIAVRLGAPGTSAGLEARLDAAASAYVDPLRAQAARTDAVVTRVGHTEAAVEETRSALVDLDGRIVAYFRIAATDPDGTTYVEIVRSNGAGRIVLGGDVLVKGSVSADEIEANGITQTYDDVNANTLVLPTYQYDLVTLNVPMARPGTIMVMAAYQFTFPDRSAWSAQIAVGDHVLQTGSSESDHYASFMRSYRATAPGAYAVKARAAARDPGTVSVNAGACSLLILRTYT